MKCKSTVADEYATEEHEASNAMLHEHAEISTPDELKGVQ